MPTFKSISLHNWRQFSDVDVDLHPRLTILTGANGAGKSTILNIFSQHFGFSRPFISTPRRKKGGGILYDLGYFTSDDRSIEDERKFEDDKPEEFGNEDDDLLYIASRPNSLETNRPTPGIGEFVDIGAVVYDDGTSAKLGFIDNPVQSFALSIVNQQSVMGIAISSHRAISSYQQVQGLSLQLVNLSNAYQAFAQEYIARLNGGHTGSSPLYRIKETLIAMAAFGEGNNHLEKNAELSAAFDGFTDVLRKVLPKELGFQRIVVRVPDIVLKTRSGEFVLDASSGGITAIIEISWQLYLFSLVNSSFVATLDEPENHLHPAMQRSILSNLLSTFPNVQFIVATHSPFIVSAVEDSKVVALRYIGSVGQSGLPRSGPRRVRSIALDQARKAGNASDILREVLGVNVSIPEWAEKRLEKIISSFEGQEIAPDTLKSLRLQLSEAGFSEYYPEALAKLVKDQ